MVLSKLDLAFVAIVAAGLLWIEHEDRVIVIGAPAIIAAPAAAEVAGPVLSVCPATDDAPFSADCLKFINGGVLPGLDAAASVSAPVPAHAAEDVRGRAPACPPSNENAPYSASCLRFLSGWFFQPFPDAQPR